MEEISLREIVEVIIKRKWLVAVITTACIFLAAIYSYLLVENTYEARTMLMVSPIAANNTSSENDSIEDIVSNISRYPGMTVETYKEQVKAPEVLKFVQEEADLKELSLEQVASKINVQAIDDTNILTISSTDNNPKKAADIANLVSKKFTEFVSETNRKQAKNAAEFIKTEQDREKERLDEAHEKLKSFLAQPRGPEELKQELSSKLNQLTNYKAEKNSTVLNLNVQQHSLQRTKEIIKQTPLYFELERSLSGDNVMLGIVKDTTGGNTAELAGLMIKEQEINPAYTELAIKANNLETSITENEAKLTGIGESVALLQSEIEILQAEYAEKQQKFDQYEHEYTLIKNTYDAYRQKYKEAMIKQSAELGKSSIMVVSEAITPEKAVSPNRELNISIAVVLGLMISLFTVFVLEYWESSGQHTQEKNAV